VRRFILLVRVLLPIVKADDKAISLFLEQL
jgi:hypothetical protein